MRLFLAGVLVGLLIATGATWVRGQIERIDNMEHYLESHPIPSFQLTPQTEPEPEHHGAIGELPRLEA